MPGRARQQAKGTRVERDQLRNQTIFTFRERETPRGGERIFYDLKSGLNFIGQGY
jgi:hypothetical protein